MSDTQVDEVIELPDDTVSDSWNKEDGDRTESVEHEEEIDGGS